MRCMAVYKKYKRVVLAHGNDVCESDFKIYVLQISTTNSFFSNFFFATIAIREKN